MNLIKLYYFDIDKLNDDIINNLKYINDIDIINSKKYKKKENEYQNIISTYFKKKYIKDYYIDKFNKPKSDNIYFNISHAKNMVIFAYYNKDIGIDIEKIKEVDLNLKRYISTDIEFKLINNDIDFFKIWTSKESLAKCIGMGINKDIKEFISIPFDGKKIYLDNIYYSHIINKDDFIISVTIKDNTDFNIILEEEILEFK